MLAALATGHSGNIFGAHILPDTANSLLVTGAADGEVSAGFVTLSIVEKPSHKTLIGCRDTVCMH